MHNQKIHTQVVGKMIHKVLLDNAVVAGVGTAAVTKENYAMRFRILLPQMALPYHFDVVTDELGSVVAGPYRQVSDIPDDIVDAVRGDLSVDKRLEVVVKRLRLSDAQSPPTRGSG